MVLWKEFHKLMKAGRLPKVLKLMNIINKKESNEHRAAKRNIKSR